MRRPSLPILLAWVLVLTSAWPALAQSNDADGDGLRDRFEERWGVTDPDRADSDGDGLSDAMEDLDGDGLGNLGEQRYGTDPANPDSDGNGTIDGQEDSDGDGATDAREQDRRALPSDVQPTPERAWWDRPPNYDDECHADQDDSRLRSCIFGAKDAETTVVLFGDSHALQWQPGLEMAASADGWRIQTLTKAACPPAQIRSSRKEQSSQRSCDLWRAKALDWIAKTKPELVLMTGGGRIYRLEDDKGERISGDDRTEAWNTGLTATIEAIPEATTTLVLADTPFLETNPATCLQNDPSDLVACSTSRSSAVDDDFDAAEQATVEAAGGTYANLTDLICPYSPCPVVFDDVLAWRNRDHLTATFVRTLAPSLGRIVREAIEAAMPVDPEADASETPAVTEAPAGEGSDEAG